MSRKILFLINNLNRGGAENVFVDQANYLLEHGYDVSFGVLSEANKADFKAELKLEPINFGFKNIFDFDAYRRIAKFVKTNKIDCLYSTLDNANIAARVASMFNHNTCVVIRESGMADRKSWKIKSLDKFLNNFVDKIIAVSDEVKDSLVAYQPKHASKIEVFMNGVNLPFDENGLEQVLSTKDQSTINILSIGSMKDDNKGQAGLIKTVGAIRQSNPELNIKLILVSDGKLRPELEALAESHAVTGRVIFTGYLDRGQINNWYRMSDIYILNSRNEGCPNVVLEAMSYGLPVIATKVGGTRQIIDDGINGFLLKRGDYSKMKELIITLAGDKNKRLEIGRAAYHKIERDFMWADKMEELIKLLKLNQNDL